MNRTEQQAAGTHPAPCARHCEANAFQIEIRRLQSHVAALEIERDNLQGQVEILTTAIQAASSAMTAAPIVSRYHRAAIEALRDYAGQDQQHEVGKDIDHANELRRLREAEKDAARYRWLRALPKGSCHGSGMTITIANARPDPCSWMNDSVRGDDMDAAIDAAMQSTEAGDSIQGEKK